MLQSPGLHGAERLDWKPCSFSCVSLASLDPLCCVQAFSSRESGGRSPAWVAGVPCRAALVGRRLHGSQASEVAAHGPWSMWVQ